MLRPALTTCLAVVIAAGLAPGNEPPRETESPPGGHPIRVARVFGDHMVLQADRPIRIWGAAAPGSRVSVRFGDQSQAVTADNRGKWFVELAPQTQNAEPTRLIVSDGKQVLTLQDVLVGEVWFCAGQSNMEWQLRNSTHAATAIASADDAQLRLLDFAGAARGGSGVYTQTHFERLTPARFCAGQWQLANPESAKSFSAVAYYFAKHLREQLDCPVGVIDVAIGGTPVEAWVATDRLRADPNLSGMVQGNWLDNPALDDWCKQRAQSNLRRGLAGELRMPGDAEGPNHSFKPGFMYRAAVTPFIPMSIRGVIWYQGESNAGSPARIQQYQQAFPLMVNDWRAQFRNPDMPWVFVQLPALGRPHWPLFRDIQRRSLAELQHVGMAITMDVGHPTNVHPPSKQPVGRRLARWALTNTYGQPGVSMGPLYDTKQVAGEKMTITFDSVGAGLTTPTDQPPTHFELAGADRVFYPATAKLAGDSVILLSPNVSQPVHARYAWRAFPQPAVNLFNSAGIPASPFTTEQTPDEVTIDKIWDASPHNAFTDLIRWNDKFYCSFRTGTGHVPGDSGEDGKIQILASTDGNAWQSIAHLAEPEVDLRDPKLSITPDGRLMVLMGGSYYHGRTLVKRNSRVTFLSPDSDTFSEITPLVLEPEIAENDQWLWRVTWHRGTGYGVVYQAGRQPWGLHLIKTHDGVHYQPVKTLSLPGRPNESTVRFTTAGEMRIVVRNEDHHASGHWGKATAPYTDFDWHPIPLRLGGPNTIQLPSGEWILGTRQYSQPTRTIIGLLSDTGEFSKRYEFPSAGDTSYPGLLVHDHQLWVSYYASHEGRTSIYLARVPLSALNEKLEGENHSGTAGAGT